MGTQNPPIEYQSVSDTQKLANAVRKVESKLLHVIGALADAAGVAKRSSCEASNVLLQAPFVATRKSSSDASLESAKRLETRVLEPLENPFGPKLLPM